jgi:holo-[acyl-carrier protein] synthase
MIIGIGNDLVDIRRIEDVLKRHGDRFALRCFTQAEREKAMARADRGGYADTLAKRFAAKGVRGDIFLRDIGVEEDPQGRPVLRLTGGALCQLEAMTPKDMKMALHLSLSDEKPYAQAFVVIEAVPV